MIGNNDRVVCVRDDFHPMASMVFDKLPEKGKVYVVRESEMVRGKLGIRLVGVNGLWNEFFEMEEGFFADRFRKLSTDPGKKKQAAVCSE